MKVLQIVLMLVVGAGITHAEDLTPSDDALVLFVAERTNAVRITAAPVQMFSRVATLCDIPQEELQIRQKLDSSGQRLENPHWRKFAHVYVSSAGAPAMRTNDAVFPRGTIIVKEKFSDAEGKHTELFTGMVKREKGYNPDCGDWEFFGLRADGKKIAERGKLQSCMDCHVEYKERDFVTKNYVSNLQSGARDK